MPKSFFKNIVRAFFSFEMLFVLFLFSYQFKHAHVLLETYDVTLFSILLLIPFFVILYKKTTDHKFWDIFIVAFFLFFLWELVAHYWSPSQYYKWKKLVAVILYTVPAFLMAYHLISRSDVRLIKLLNAFLIFGFIITAETLRIHFNNPTAIVEVFGNNYLVTGQTLGVFIICLTYLSFIAFEKEKYLQFMILLFLLGITFFALLSTGGRGPVLAVVFTGCCWLALPTRIMGPYKQRFIVMGSLIVMSLLVYFLMKSHLTFELNHFTNRIPVSIEDVQRDGPLQERFEYYFSAIKAFIENPLIGIGFGGWPTFHGLGEKEIHPHNMFLEILSETGMIGFLFFSFMIYRLFKRVSFNYECVKNKIYIVYILLVPFSFFNTMKSGDLNDNILFFVALGLVAGAAKK